MTRTTDLSLAQPLTTETCDSSVSQDKQPSDCYQERDTKNSHSKSVVHTPDPPGVRPYYGGIPTSRQVSNEYRETELNSNESLLPCNDDC